ncbi:MAG: hypothetical protein R2684_05045 [Pyrinomonadaceae bacterium]
MIKSDLLEPYNRLIEISILGRTFKVPENNSLLRCFQYLWMDEISRGDFCWNRDCMNCQVWVESNGKDKPLISCRAKSQENMKIVAVRKELADTDAFGQCSESQIRESTATG